MVSPRIAWHLLGAVSATMVGALALWLNGPSPVVHVHYAKDHQASFLYMVSVFPFFGLLCGEAVHRLSQDRREGWLLIAQLLAMGLLAVGRLVWKLPVSGHVLLQAFFLLEAPRLCRRPARHLYLLAGGLALAALLWTKLALWQDAVTPTLGTAAGLLVWAAGEHARD